MNDKEKNEIDKILADAQKRAWKKRLAKRGIVDNPGAVRKIDPYSNLAGLEIDKDSEGYRAERSVGTVYVRSLFYKELNGDYSTVAIYNVDYSTGWEVFYLLDNRLFDNGSTNKAELISKNPQNKELIKQLRGFLLAPKPEWQGTVMQDYAHYSDVRFVHQLSLETICNSEKVWKWAKGLVSSGQMTQEQYDKAWEASQLAATGKKGKSSKKPAVTTSSSNNAQSVIEQIKKENKLWD